ncbi:MAG: TGS domain-containing protein, partial [Clostridia bacterium]|nr:TGS domain-containing protein [Clostridia bacterium]
MRIQLPDGHHLDFDESVTGLELAKKISNGLAKKALAVKVNGQVQDLDMPLKDGDAVEVLTFDDPEGAEAFHHTSSHVLAQALQNLYPGTKLAIGPAIENGFYYDVDSDHQFTPEDISKIEDEMRRVIKKNAKLVKKTLPRDEAIKLFQAKDEPYKVELIEDLPEGEEISIYEMGDFVDLCAGPHIPRTGLIKALKIMSL